MEQIPRKYPKFAATHEYQALAYFIRKGLRSADAAIAVGSECEMVLNKHTVTKKEGHFKESKIKRGINKKIEFIEKKTEFYCLFVANLGVMTLPQVPEAEEDLIVL